MRTKFAHWLVAIASIILTATMAAIGIVERRPPPPPPSLYMIECTGPVVARVIGPSHAPEQPQQRHFAASDVYGWDVVRIEGDGCVMTEMPAREVAP